VDDDQTVLIADWGNSRIVEWTPGATSGRVVAGGNGPGKRTDQLSYPRDVIADKETNSLIICDWVNRRVMRWFRGNVTNGETLIDNIGCWGLSMDDQRFLYVSDFEKHEVRRYRYGEKNGTVVAGGTGRGTRLDQLSHPSYIFVDRDYSIYVSENGYPRVMKWAKDAKEGTVVARSSGQGNTLIQLFSPTGMFVDQLGTFYVADSGDYDRVIRLLNGTTQGNVIVDGNGPSQGDVIVGGNGDGQKSNQLNSPMGLTFDRHGNLYVAEWGNNRVQRFSIQAN
jgi:sugar lactone lactonase YvrE